MAKALECPACGAKHRLDTLPDGPTFRCSQCGQVLKIPDVASNGGAPAPSTSSSNSAPPRRAVTATAATSGKAAADTAPPAPPKRRRPAGDAAAASSVSSTSNASTRQAVGVSATVAAVASEPQTRADRRAAAPAKSKSKPRAQSAGPKGKVAWYWRLLAWIVAVPLGFVITVWPAYHLDLIRKDDVLNIFVGSGSGRYVRLGIGTCVWALVTALLVQLFVEGGRWYMARRRARPSQPQSTSSSSSGSRAATAR